jgi:hypothetical protein
VGTLVGVLVSGNQKAEIIAPTETPECPPSYSCTLQDSSQAARAAEQPGRQAAGSPSRKSVKEARSTRSRDTSSSDKPLRKG